MEFSAISGVLGAFKALRDTAQSMIGLHDSQAFQSKMIEFQSKILDAHSAVFAANEERSTLVETVSQLEKRLADLERWEAEKERYKLTQLPPAIYVYTLQPDMAAGEPIHHICQLCYQRGKKSILHADEQHNGIYHLVCDRCKTKLQVGHFQAPPDPYESGGHEGSWMVR